MPFVCHSGKGNTPGRRNKSVVDRGGGLMTVSTAEGLPGVGWLGGHGLWLGGSAFVHVAEVHVKMNHTGCRACKFKKLNGSAAKVVLWPGGYQRVTPQF